MKIRLSFKVALGSFIVAGLGVLIFAYLSYSQISDCFKRNLLYHLSIEVNCDASDIKRALGSVQRDVKAIANSEEISGFIRAYNNKYNYDEVENIKLQDWKGRLKKKFITYMQQNESYFQIRFIGVKDKGKEIFRIDKKDEIVYLIKDKNLQQKGNKKYFKETIILDKNEIYISNINLNKEYGNITFPIIPTIRVATPIYDEDNNLFGIIIINSNTDKLFHLDKYRNIEAKETYLVDKDGCYLFHNDIDKTFSFEFKKSFNIRKEFDISDILDNNKRYVKYYKDDTLAFFAQKIDIGDSFIVLSKSASNIFLKEQSDEYTNKMVFYILGVTFMIAVFSAILTRLLTSNILKLTKRAKEVANSHGKDIVKFSDLKSNDEIGELSNSIETMVKNLLESQNKLSSFATSLEAEVKERTKEQEILLSIFDKGDSVLFKWNNDENWSVDSVSFSIEKLLGYTKENFINNNIVYSDCIYKDDLQRVKDEVVVAMSSGVSFFEHKPYRLLNKDNKIIWIHDNTIILRDEKTDEVTHFLGYLTDITELKELNDQLEKKVDEGIEKLRDKDELLAQQTKLAAMGEMIGAIAHQWRQPLNALAVQIQFMEDDFEDGLIDKEYLIEYKNENMKLINFMSKTIDDFRNFFRVDKVKTVFNAKQKIEETINILSSQLKSNKIDIILDGESFNTLGFESEFQQVVLNIINNSKDAILENKIEKGSIKIDIELDNNIAKILLKDNAGGIPEDIITRIFDPYFTTKEQGKGTGLGLYMSKMIIEDNMGGKIDVINSNIGAVFKIELEIDR